MLAPGEEGHQLFLYSGHDTTVMPLLRALGLAVERWPGYVRCAACCRVWLTNVAAELLLYTCPALTSCCMQRAQRPSAVTSMLRICRVAVAEPHLFRVRVPAATWCSSCGSGQPATAGRRRSTSSACCTRAKCFISPAQTRVSDACVSGQPCPPRPAHGSSCGAATAGALCGKPLPAGMPLLMSLR